MITLPEKYKSTDYFEHGYKKTMTDKRCTRCTNVKRTKRGLHYSYYCTILDKIITPHYFCMHFKRKPKRVNKVIDKQVYDRKHGAEYRAKDKIEREKENGIMMQNKCLCIKDYAVKFLQENRSLSVISEQGKTYYFKDTATIIPSRLIFKVVKEVPKFLFRLDTELFNKYFEVL